ncbi:hypothetical protein KBB96_06995 [Luteolibacter ambystomatis]|uniref:Uncharacterized protein n=1 Tax=Luteolibacter ambystomatis TaxID=2824561 RepID=A0A975J265_9BACT|nr:hypothetical protein [Luteolibacter ambystomatis]QUE52634.1 hypothetical protein KBB96_06995 [Luteolibacter ambystomatis]
MKKHIDDPAKMPALLRGKQISDFESVVTDDGAIRVAHLEFSDGTFLRIDPCGDENQSLYLLYAKTEELISQ